MTRWVAIVLCWISAQSVAAELNSLPPVESAIFAVSAVSQNNSGGDEILSVLDEPRDFLAGKFVAMVNGIDRFFANDRDFQEGNHSALQLDLTRVSGYSGNNELVLSGRAKVNLPNTERNLHFLLESNPDQNPTGAQAPLTQPTTLNNVTAPNSYAAAIRAEKTANQHWFFSSDAGIKFQGLNSTPFTRARASYADNSGEWRIKLAETAFWFNTLGVGATTQLDLEHTLSANVLFRASSNATWLHDKKNTDLRQDWTIYHTLNERSAWLYQASVVGASQPQFHTADYILLAQYRYRLHQKWMFLDVTPQLHYPQTRAYHPSPAFSVRLEMLFDAQK